MKKIYFTMALLGSLTFMNAQETHEVGTSGFSFTPDTIHLQSGDFIHFTSTGSHSMTEVDESTWLADGNTSNGGFDTGVISDSDVTFEVNGSGTLYFVCTPHASLGMKGVIIVDTPNDLRVNSVSTKFSVYPNPVESDLNLNLPLSFEGQIQIIDLSGQVRMLESTNGIKILDLSSLSPGIYFVRLINGDGIIENTIRVIKN